jgi:hypothetical protein
MNTLLIFFALPVATIILAIVLERILRCPILTSATFFAIYLIVAFAVFDASFLVFVIVYTILAFVTALIAEIFFNRCRIPNLINCHDSSRNSQGVVLSDESISQIATRVAEILNEESESSTNCNCNCSSNEVASVNVRNNTTGARSSWCCYRR